MNSVFLTKSIALQNDEANQKIIEKRRYEEEELIKNIDSGKISFAAIDTFEGEPNPSIKILMNPNISLTPHIGAATNEAQDRIGIELADKINDILG